MLSYEVWGLCNIKLKVAVSYVLRPTTFFNSLYLGFFHASVPQGNNDHGFLVISSYLSYSFSVNSFLTTSVDNVPLNSRLETILFASYSFPFLPTSLVFTVCSL